MRQTATALFDAGKPAGLVEKTAWISDCDRYRYSLGRVWDDALPTVCVVGLNPSTADAEQDDPTIRRCIRFARDWGYGSLLIVNLYAWRATDPGALPVAPEAIGPLNDEHLRCTAMSVRACGGIVVAAWGAHPMAAARSSAARRLLMGPLYVLGLTAAGEPRHPLYMKASCTPIPWPPGTGS